MAAEQIPLCFLLSFFGVKTKPAKSARNLGVIFDNTFTFRSYIPAMCISYFYHIRDLWCIYHYLDLDTAKLLANALVSGLLDYCNSLLYGMADTDLTKLFRIDWPTCWHSHLHLLAVFHCFIPFISCQYNLEYCSRSVCWPAKHCVKSSLFIFTPCLSHHSHPVLWDQIEELRRQSLGKRPTKLQEHFTHAPLLFGRTCHCLSAEPLLISCKLQATSEDKSLWLGLSPIDASTPDGPLMLQHCFIDFAVEYWFGCRATVPGFTGDIGTIETWLIDWYKVCFQIRQ